jgi:hypothetical protein
VVVGVAFGYLGYRWRARGSRLGPTLVALAFVVEPLVHLSGLNTRFTGGGYALHATNVAIWGTEALLGAAGLIWVWRPRRAGRAAERAEPADVPMTSPP